MFLLFDLFWGRKWESSGKPLETEWTAPLYQYIIHSSIYLEIHSFTSIASINHSCRLLFIHRSCQWRFMWMDPILMTWLILSIWQPKSGCSSGSKNGVKKGFTLLPQAGFWSQLENKQKKRQKQRQELWKRFWAWIPFRRSSIHNSKKNKI